MSPIDNLTYQRYLVALLAGERSQCARIVHELVTLGADLKDLYIHLFQRALYQVGMMWEQQRISVAVEHLATAITERMMTLVQPQTFHGPTRDKTIIIACVADEYHQLGGRMIADICELRGWHAYYLGANTPLPDLLNLVRQRQPTLLGLSLSLPLNLPALLRAVAGISQEFAQLPILVGGQAFQWGGLSNLLALPRVSYIASLFALEQTMLTYEQ